MYVSDCIIILLASFLLGSIPFGLLLAKLFKLKDPRTVGSGNIGATNMMRTGSKKVAALTLLLDALKGALPVLFVLHELHAAPAQAALALLAALVGHCYTPWLKGKGGKGVATALGGALAFSLPLAIGFCLTWLIVFFMTRLVSLASIITLMVLPVVAFFEHDPITSLIFSFAAAVGIWRHRTNITRLRDGTEPKL